MRAVQDTGQKRQLPGFFTHTTLPSRPFHPTFQRVGAGCGVCWATASNLSSCNAQRLADTAGFDATARWGCNSHRPGAVSGCCDLLKNAEVGPWPTTRNRLGPGPFRPPGRPGSGHADIWRLEIWNAKPRGLWHDHCPTLVRDMEERPSPPLSSDLSVARVKTCRSLARHGRRQDTAADLWSEAQVSWTCAVALEPSSPSSSSVLHELRLNQLSTLWRCTGAFVLTARDAARSTPELAGPKPGKHSAADGGGGREECSWLAVALPQPYIQGRGVPLNKNPADANPGDNVAAATTCYSLPVQPHAHRATGRPGLGLHGQTQVRSRGLTRAV